MVWERMGEVLGPEPPGWKEREWRDGGGNDGEKGLAGDCLLSPQCVLR